MLPPDLDEAISNLSFPGSVHAGGSYTLPPPGLKISDLPDAISLPLLPIQAEQIAGIASQCPHGKGLDTIVDKSVRDCLQVNASKLTFQNPTWPTAIANLVKHAAEQLGVPAGSVRSELYKLLLYKKGGHFKAHRDTEKMKGMFATLTVQLPSSFKGGELVVRHAGQQVVYDSGAGGASSFSTFYTAFYADVEHEIRPVMEGYRLALVYSLAWVGAGAVPKAAGSELKIVAKELRRMVKRCNDDRWTLVFDLEHQYTEASLSRFGIRSLKGKDRNRIGALNAAGKVAKVGELEIVVCKLTRTDSKWGNGYPGEGIEVQEIEKGEIEVEKAYNADGSQFQGDLEFINWEMALYGEDASDGEEDYVFYEEEAGKIEYTGNEGATQETTYGAMVVAMWQKDPDAMKRRDSGSRLKTGSKTQGIFKEAIAKINLGQNQVRGIEQTQDGIGPVKRQRVEKLTEAYGSLSSATPKSIDDIISID